MRHRDSHDAARRHTRGDGPAHHKPQWGVRYARNRSHHRWAARGRRRAPATEFVATADAAPKSASYWKKQALRWGDRSALWEERAFHWKGRYAKSAKKVNSLRSENGKPQNANRRARDSGIGPQPAGRVPDHATRPGARPAAVGDCRIPNDYEAVWSLVFRPLRARAWPYDSYFARGSYWSVEFRGDWLGTGSSARRSRAR
jgi:hypothetical protein